MFVQATTPRPLFDHLRNPRYLHIHTLAKAGVSEGTVRFSGTTDPEFGKGDGVFIEPLNTYPIKGEDGFEVLEYALPFWRLFQRPDNFEEAIHDGSVVASADVSVVRYCTGGFGVVCKSAFRASPREYQEHTIAFKMIFPATGGGIIRLADCLFDISNQDFDPWAPDPTKRLGPGPSKDLELQISYNRTHKLSSSAIEDRRASRVAAAEASMARSGTLPATGNRPALPPKR